jgi:hypothetical protein
MEKIKKWPQSNLVGCGWPKSTIITLDLFSLIAFGW